MSESKRLSAAELDAIGKRASEATAGPWMAIQSPDICGTCENIYEVVESDVYLQPIVAELKSDSDAEFIARSRSDVPALLAEVKLLQEEAEGLRSLLERTMVHMKSMHTSAESMASALGNIAKGGVRK